MAVKISELTLPMAVVTKSDVSQLAREIEALDDFLNQAAIREGGSPVDLPKTSQLFEEVVSTNKLNMLKKEERELLRNFIQAVHTKAPRLHMSFNSDPSHLFLQKLMTWLRQNIHPYLLLQVGLQPNMGAGCSVRSDNKYFDFSLRQKFADQRMLLISQLVGQTAEAGQTDTARKAEV